MPEKVRLERDRAAQRVCRRQVRAAAAPGPQQGGPCVERDSLLNTTGSECAVHCTALQALHDAVRGTTRMACKGTPSPAARSRRSRTRSRSRCHCAAMRHHCGMQHSWRAPAQRATRRLQRPIATVRADVRRHALAMVGLMHARELTLARARAHTHTHAHAHAHTHTRTRTHSHTQGPPVTRFRFCFVR